MSLAILGGGPAGLAAGLYAEAAGQPFQVFEAAAEPGGNCRTLRFGEFLVDTGAHRLHDRDPQATALARDLLGDDLLSVDAPSRLVHDGRWLEFPLAPLDLLRSLPVHVLGAIVRENLALRLRGDRLPRESFGAVARHAYGPTLASFALLGYSRKLWGRDPDLLLPEAAGARLNRLDLRTFLLEALSGRRSARTHLDGAFLYPRFGIGQLFAAAAERLGTAVHLDAPVTRLRHEDSRIVDVEIAGIGGIEPDEVINTLPIGLTAALLDPAPPEAILASARAIRFRSLRLCIVLLARERFSECASIYFPDPDVPFTRLYECRNRSAAMAPGGATALVLEVPCEPHEPIARLGRDHFFEHVLAALERTCGIRPREIIDTHEVMMPNAYPVLERSVRPHLERLGAYLARFENMRMVGRNANFSYTSIHDMFREARNAVSGARAGLKYEV